MNEPNVPFLRPHQRWCLAARRVAQGPGTQTDIVNIHKMRIRGREEDRHAAQHTAVGTSRQTIGLTWYRRDEARDSALKSTGTSTTRSTRHAAAACDSSRSLSVASSTPGDATRSARILIDLRWQRKCAQKIQRCAQRIQRCHIHTSETNEIDWHNFPHTQLVCWLGLRADLLYVL